MTGAENAVEARTKKQVKLGTILSYFVLICEFAINLLFFPWLAKSIGQGNYGLYTLASSTIGIFLLDFGLSAAVSKFLSQYRATNDKQSAENFLGLVFKLYLIIDVVIFVVVFAVYFFLGVLKGLEETELVTFQSLYIIVGIYSIASFPLIPVNGILGANEDYIVIKLCTLVQKIISVTLMALAVIFGFGVFGVVLATVGTSLVVSLFKVLYIRFKMKIKPRFSFKDKGLLKTIFVFSFWISIIVLGQKILSNLASPVMGIVSNSSEIAVFGFALTLETYAYSLSTVVSDMFLPKITRMTAQKNQEKAFDRLFSFVGKIQMVVIALIFMGFCIFGYGFTTMLMGQEYEESYICTILLIAPLVIQVPKQVMESQSYVMNTVKDTAIIVIITSIVGLGLMFLFGKLFGATGICLAVCIAQVVCAVLRDFLVYQKKQHISMGRFILKTYLRFLPTAVLCTGVGIVLILVKPVTSWKVFIAEAAGFTLFYIITVWFLYFSEDEKNKISSLFFAKIESDDFPKKTASPFKQSLGFLVKNIHLFFKKLFFSKSKSGAPYVLCLLAVVLCFFSSDYAVDKVALVAMCGSFFIAICLFFYYRFPLFAFGKKPREFFHSFYEAPFLIAIVTAGSMALTYFVTHDFSTPFGIIRILMIVATGFLIVEVVSFDEFRSIYRKVLPIICLFSLALFAAINIGGYSFLRTNYSTYEGFGLFFFTTDSLIERNFGQFWEPGVFSSFILFGCLLEIAFEKKADWKRIVLYSITIFSTVSLAGIMLLPLVFLLLLMKHFKSKWLLLVPGILLLFLVVTIGFWDKLSPYLSSFFPAVFAKGASLSTRVMALRVSFEIYLHSPIFGVGNNYGTYFAALQAGAYAGLVDSSVSTTGYLIAMYGWLGFFLLAVLMTSCLSIKNGHLAMNGTLFLIIIIIINKEPHVQSTLSWTMFFYLINEGIQKGLFERKKRNVSFETLNINYHLKERKAKKPVLDPVEINHEAIKNED